MIGLNSIKENNCLWVSEIRYVVNGDMPVSGKTDMDAPITYTALGTVG